MLLSPGRFSILEEDSATKREAKSMVILLYALTEVDNVTQEGKFVFQGAAAYSTNSTGKLSFLNNMMGIFKGEGDINTGDLVPQNGDGNRYIANPQDTQWLKEIY